MKKTITFLGTLFFLLCGWLPALQAQTTCYTVWQDDGGGTLSVYNSIVYGNTAGLAPGVTLSSVNAGAMAANLVDVNPVFESLVDYNLMSTTSPAYNVGDNSKIDLTTDIKGRWRKDTALVDIGAYELTWYNISNPITPYTVSGTTTIAAGGTASVTLSDSETGVTYTLWKNGVLTSVTPISGTNAAISFTGLGEGTYTIKGENSLGVTQMLGNAIISLATKQLTLKVYLEGLWNGTAMNKCKKWDDGLGDFADAFSSDIVDTISVELRNATYSEIAYQIHGLELHQDGTVTTTGQNYVEVPGDATGSYYVTIRTRNHLETTTAALVPFAGSTVDYDFTDSDSKAYVFSEATFTSQKPKDGKWMIYVGNILQEVDYPQVSFLDMMQVFENYSDTKAVYGYLQEDLNGDGFVDFMDLLMCFGNSADGIYFYKE